MHRLDNYSKILLAIQSISYMANGINAVNEQIKMMPKPEDNLTKPIIEGVAGREEILNDTLTKLCSAMEDLGDFMNNHDCIIPMDERITSEAFQILFHGKDDTEK